MQLKDHLPSNSKKSFPIWAHLTPTDDSRESTKADHDELEVAVENYLRGRCLKEYDTEFWKSNRRKLVDLVMERLGDDDPSIHRLDNDDDDDDDSCTNNPSLLLKSLEPQRTSKGVIVDLREISSRVALSFNEYDEKKWGTCFVLATGNVSLGTLTRGISAKETSGGEWDHHWWSRPLWAWTWHERLCAHATFLMLDFVAQSTIQVRVVLSNSDIFDVESPSPWDGSRSQDAEYYPVRLFYEPRSLINCIMTPGEEDDCVEMEEPKEQNAVLVQSDAHGESSSIGMIHPSSGIENTEANSHPASGGNTVQGSNYKKTEDFQNSDEILPISEICKPSSQEESQQATVVSFASQEDIEEASSPDLLATGFPEKSSEQEDVDPKVYNYKQLEVTPSPKGAPQIDSQGIDLSMLSQLPADVRSEVRMAAAIQGREKRQVQFKSSIHRWLSVTKTSTRPSVGLKRSATKSLDGSQAKKTRGIREFLSRKGENTS